MSESRLSCTIEGNSVSKRRELAPDIEAAFDAFSQRVFADGALSTKVNKLVAVAAARRTDVPICIKGHTKAASTATRPPRS